MSRLAAAPAAEKGGRISDDWALILSEAHQMPLMRGELPKDEGGRNSKIYSIVDEDRRPGVLILTPGNTVVSWRKNASA